MAREIARVSFVILAAAAAVVATAPAFATDGYFQIGYGARQKALGGAGVADSRDATAAALNPAGILNAPNQELSIAVSAFMPHRYMEGGPANPFPGFSPIGRTDSDSTLFFIPNMAWSTRIDSSTMLGLVDAIGLTVYGNGGMNTNYGAVGRNLGIGECFAPPPAPPGTPVGTQNGIFCGGRMGVNMQQAFMSIAFAKQLGGGLSIGFAPILARQQIEIEGLTAFSFLSSNPGYLTNAGTDVSWGGGARAGIEWSIAPGFRLGVAGNSRIYMNRFEHYRGLFAEQGDFDIPASVQAGLAVDLTRQITAMVDYKHIWYGSIRSIANPSTNHNTVGCAFGVGGGCLGQDNGSGFGWRDVDVVKFGLEWRNALPGTTLRAGYSYNTSPIEARDVMFNILAPGIVQHHITAGAEVALTNRMKLEVAGMYVPESTLKGFEIAPGNVQHAVEVGMHQYEVTAAIKYRFGD